MQMCITGVRNEFDVIAQNAKVSMTITVSVDLRYPQMKDGSHVSTFTHSDVISILSMRLLSPDFTSLVLATHSPRFFLFCFGKLQTALYSTPLLSRKIPKHSEHKTRSKVFVVQISSEILCTL